MCKDSFVRMVGLAAREEGWWTESIPRKRTEISLFLERRLQRHLLSLSGACAPLHFIGMPIFSFRPFHHLYCTDCADVFHSIIWRSASLSDCHALAFDGISQYNMLLSPLPVRILRCMNMYPTCLQYWKNRTGRYRQASRWSGTHERDRDIRSKKFCVCALVV